MEHGPERIVPPNTARIVEGLRDTGYSFEAALADLIDNSISHGQASVVSVRVLLMGDGPDERAVVQVADDGIGMDEDRLVNAMKYGADELENPHSLGKFGLGLKTASTSFCRRLTVLTRADASAENRPLHAVWDLDRIAETGEWRLGLAPAADDFAALFDDELGMMGAPDGSSGTIIVWQKVDRLLKTKAGTPAKDKKKALDRIVSEARGFLSTVFQRFLDPDDKRAPHVRILVNDAELTPWDPFMTGRIDALVKESELPFEDSEGVRPVFRSYIMPAKREMDAEDAAYANHSLERQGIYLYREERQIDGPPLYPWLRIWSPETHQNNHRVEVSFPATMDELFGVGLRKSGVELSAEVKEELERLLGPLRREADQRSRKGKATKSKEDGDKRSDATEKTIGRKRLALTLPGVEDGPGDEIRVSGHEGEWVARDPDGAVTGIVRVRPDDDERATAAVTRESSLEDGVLYEPVVGQVTQVAVNTGHDWYQKTIAPNEDDAQLMQALDFMLYALAQAELMVTDESLWPRFHQFRIDVSKNLRELVQDLETDKD
jgi:hypothetical protein